MAGNKNQSDAANSFKAAAEQSVDQARKAFHDMMSMARKAVHDADSNAAQIQDRFRDMTKETLDFAGASAEAAFELVQRLAAAKNPEDALTIQRNFIEAQMERLGRQARTVSDSAIRAARDFTKPLDR